MPDKLMHFHLKDVCPDEDNPLRITTRLYADVVDMTDNLIVDACVKEARRAGVNDVYLLDRQFVLDALREKIQGTQREKFLLDKIKQLGEWLDAINPECLVEVDGGVDAETCAVCKENGADVLVAGSAYFKATDRAEFVKIIQA